MSSTNEHHSRRGCCLRHETWVWDGTWWWMQIMDQSTSWSCGERFGQCHKPGFNEVMCQRKLLVGHTKHYWTYEFKLTNESMFVCSLLLSLDDWWFRFWVCKCTQAVTTWQWLETVHPMKMLLPGHSRFLFSDEDMHVQSLVAGSY